MNLTVNGEKKNFEVNTLSQLIELLGIHDRRIATMVNGEIVKRDSRPAKNLSEDDSIDIVTMVGGG